MMRCFLVSITTMSSLALPGCAVVAVADAAVGVAATAVSVSATVVETAVDAGAAGVKAATGSSQAPAVDSPPGPFLDPVLVPASGLPR